MDSNKVKEVCLLLIDLRIHKVYEIHEKYRIRPSEIIDIVNHLVLLGVIERVSANEIRLIVNNRTMRFLNAAMKTSKPEVLLHSRITYQLDK